MSNSNVLLTHASPAAKQKANLANVLEQIKANHANLTGQLAQMEQQRLVALDQLANFDAVIAALQVALGDETMFAKVGDQLAHLAANPLTDAGAGAGQAASANDAQLAEAAASPAGEVPAESSNGSLDAANAA